MKYILATCLLFFSSSLFAQQACEFTLPNTIKNVNGHYPVEIVCSCAIRKVEVIVYNRWGVEIYKSNNLIHDWQGKDSQDGTYYILVKGEYTNREKFEATGFVNFFR